MAAVIKYSLLSFPIASVGLGVWQIKRLEWKTGLLAKLEAQLKAEPIDLFELQKSENLNDLEYRRVKAKGRYDQNPEHQIYLSPRQLVVNNEALHRGRTAHQSNIGVNVITPFHLDGTDKKIIVNRGWLATRGNKDTVKTSAHLGMGDKDELMDLVGILRTSDQRPRYGLVNNAASNEWQVRDVKAIALKLHTDPIFIDADESMASGEGPIGGQTHLNIRNEHLNYAITWFSLAAFSYIMWYSKYGRRSISIRNILFKRSRNL